MQIWISDVQTSDKHFTCGNGKEEVHIPCFVISKAYTYMYPQFKIKYYLNCTFRPMFKKSVSINSLFSRTDQGKEFRQNINVNYHLTSFFWMGHRRYTDLHVF